MPHLVMSISRPLQFEAQSILQAAHHALLRSGLFAGPDIKSRLLIAEHYLVGDDLPDQFIHADIKLLAKPERTVAVKQQLSQCVVKAIGQVLSTAYSVQISCDVIEMNPEVYSKYLRSYI